MSATTASNKPELSLSSLSLDSYSTDDLDWDRSQTDIDPSRPSIPPPSSQSQGVHEDVSLADKSQQRSLVDLLRLRARASKGDADKVELSPSEEQALEEELGRWVKSAGVVRRAAPAAFRASPYSSTLLYTQRTPEAR
ncbi:hypothetical protein FRC00_000544 [Tulasnella sp. 408]|nr:hypothetical protein FRC00_000544 [Tulasnella sp. 408]